MKRFCQQSYFKQRGTEYATAETKAYFSGWLTCLFLYKEKRKKFLEAEIMSFVKQT